MKHITRNDYKVKDERHLYLKPYLLFKSLVLHNAGFHGQFGILLTACQRAYNSMTLLHISMVKKNNGLAKGIVCRAS
jgi:hypothetical protein